MTERTIRNYLYGAFIIGLGIYAAITCAGEMAWEKIRGRR